MKRVPNCADTGLTSSKQKTETFRIVLSRPHYVSFRKLQRLTVDLEQRRLRCYAGLKGVSTCSRRLTANHTACTAAQGASVPNCSLRTRNISRESSSPTNFTASSRVFIPKSDAADNRCRIVRSPDALRPLTLCNCDRKVLDGRVLRLPAIFHLPHPHPPSDASPPDRWLTTSSKSRPRPSPTGRACQTSVASSSRTSPVHTQAFTTGGFSVFSKKASFPNFPQFFFYRGSATKAPLLLSMLVRYEATLQWLGGCILFTMASIGGPLRVKNSPMFAPSSPALRKDSSIVWSHA